MSIEDASQSNDSQIVTHCAIKNASYTLLSTAVVEVKDRYGKYHQCRALLDCGSQSNFMTDQMLKRLHLTSVNANTPIIGISQTPLTVSKRVHCEIRSKHNDFNAELSFLIIKEITGNLPFVKIDTSSLNIPANINLADPNFNHPNRVDILLSASIFWDLLCVGQIKLSNGTTLLQKTLLGWIISGPILIPKTTKIRCNLSTINKQLEKFWNIEEVESTRGYSKEEELCESHFAENYRRDISGRFIVRLPFKEDPERALGETRLIATKRFFNLEKRLQRSSELHQGYHAFINEYIGLGHMIPVADNNLSKGFYLPHHAVTKETSLTTKLRVVFDGSCNSTNGRSLNDLQMVGPNLQQDLFSILCRFRTFAYVLTSDIEKMYRQVKVSPEDTKYQRIFWRHDDSESLQTYELSTVTYGTASASYLAIKCLQTLAQVQRQSFPVGASIVLRDFYVDDLLTGANTIEDAIKIRDEVNTLLASGGFRLRKWAANQPSLTESFCSDQVVTDLVYDFDNDKCIKTLGLEWHSRRDVLQYGVNYAQTNKITKRAIISDISRIFDPLGLIGPIIITGKIMIQKLWKLQLDWDESVSMEMSFSWQQYRRELCVINKLTVPRRVCYIDTAVQISIHGFSDASEAAYGACLYICTQEADGSMRSHLLCAKSRVAPLKTISLPKLELCGALLLAKLVDKARKAICVNISNSYYWSDSTIVLDWIKSNASDWKTFVANRVGEIQQITDQDHWNHVPSEQNPADLISRGLSPLQLNNSTMWWNGPTWLTSGVNNWPNALKANKFQILERRKPRSVALTTSENRDTIFDKFSSLNKLQAVTAYCLRFKTNALSSYNKTRLAGPLSTEELETALTVLIRLAQTSEFSEETRSLRASRQLKSNSKLLALKPFIDQNGLLRVGGRLIRADLSYGQKHPILLPSGHPLTTLIIRHEHHKCLHAGVHTILSMVRCKFWPLHGQSTVKRVLRKCVTCFRANPRIRTHLMGDLPEARVRPRRPFESCGIDYAGPYDIKDGKLRCRKIVKAYLCVFVCMSTKAVHLELASDLSTESFLNALKRFVSRRGLCAHIYSDNAKIFIGTNNHLKELHNLLYSQGHLQTMQNFTSANAITWHFIPPRSPHFGGLWESAIKSAKSHLKKILTIPLTFEHMTTVLTQVEACLNSRPLTPLSDDTSDFSALTPGHFLIGQPLMALPESDTRYQHAAKLNKGAYLHLQQMVQHFWHRWSTEYLSQLQHRHKWRKTTAQEISIGMMVLLVEDNLPTLNWKLGRIIAVHPGSDGVVRVVTVRTATGHFKRSASKIAVLPIEDSN